VGSKYVLVVEEYRIVLRQRNEVLFALVTAGGTGQTC
jgi:hypothetical protein